MNSSIKARNIKRVAIVIVSIFLFFSVMNNVSAEEGGMILGLDAIEIYGIVLYYESGDYYYGTTQGHTVSFNTRSFIIRDENTGDEKRVTKYDILYPEGMGDSTVGPVNRMNTYSPSPATYGLTSEVPVDAISSLEWYNKGTALYNQGNYEEAIGAYDQAIDIDPEYAKAWNNKGAALVGLGNYEEAIVAYNKAIDIDPEYARAWFNKGNALRDLGKIEDAIDAYDIALKIDPGYVKVLNKKGLALSSIGRYDEAIEVYDKALQFDPENTDIIQNREIAVTKKGNTPVSTSQPSLVIPPKTTTSVSTKPEYQKTVTPTISSGYSDEPCKCSDSINYNCIDFPLKNGCTAQECYDYCLKKVGRDVHDLTRGDDNIACNS